MQSASQPQQGPPAASADAVVPLEFKTGKPHNSHRAQVLLVACCCSVSKQFIDIAVSVNPSEALYRAVWFQSGQEHHMP